MKKKSMFKRITAFFLAAVMLAGSAMPTHAAGTSSTTSTGETYYVTVMETKNGTVYVNGDAEEAEVEPGETVEITYKADKGYKLSTMNVLNDDAEEIETSLDDDVYTFEMPKADVVVFAEFESDGDDKQTEESDDEIVWHSRTPDEIAKNLGIEILNSEDSGIMLASTQTITGSTYTAYGCASARLRIGSKIVYCVLPWSKTPNGVSANFADISINGTSDNANYQLMAKLIYYGYGGGGDLGYDETITHFALSKVWYDMGNTYNTGLSWTYTSKAYLNSSGQAKVTEFINKVKTLTNVKGTLSIAQLYASGEQYQDVVYGTFEALVTAPDAPTITIWKKDTDGNAVSGAQFTVYGYNQNTSSYTAIETKTTDSSGKVIFSSLTESSGSYMKTGNGLFLVKETKVPDGYKTSETYLNDDDKADFETYGGRLYYVKATGGECVAYRDATALTILQETTSSNASGRLVFDHSTGNLVSDNFNTASSSDVRTCWWSSAKSQTWVQDTRLGNTYGAWYRSYQSAGDYCTSGSGGHYSLSGLNAHTYRYSGSTATALCCMGGSISDKYCYDQLWSYTTTDGKVTIILYKSNDSGSYLFRPINNTSATLNIGCAIWTVDGDQSDLIWTGGDIAAGKYTNYYFKDSDYDNVANLVVHIYNGSTFNEAATIQTLEYTDGVFVNQQVGYVKVQKASSNTTLTNKFSSSYSLSGAVYGLYSDSACSTLVSTMTTGSDGTTSAVQVAPGTYYVKETTASKGYTLDSKTYTVKVTTSNTSSNPAVVSSTEVPQSGCVQIKKVSGDETLTSGNDCYSLKGAVYGLYSDEDCTTLVTELTTDDKGTSEVQEVPIGTYYIKETKASQGYTLDTTIYTVTVTTTNTSTNPVVITSKETPETGFLKLSKVSAYPDMTANNTAYSLEGAEYCLYLDKECTKVSSIEGTDAMTTGADGTTKTYELPLGTYYVKETKASQGYTLDPNVYPVTVTADNTSEDPLIVTSTELPENDPAIITINKIWDGEATDTVPSLAGTQFTLTFYGGQYDTVEEAEAAVTADGITKRTWVIEAKKIGNKYAAYLEESFLVSGDKLFYDDGIVTLPYGTLVTQETKAAPGYTLSGNMKDLSGNIIAQSDDDTGMTYITHITADNGAVIIKGGNEFTSYDSPVYHSFKAIKYGQYGRPVEGVKYTLTDSSGNTIGTATTDENGEISFSDLYPDTYYLTETKTIDGLTLLEEPIKVELPKKISLSYAQEINLDTDADGVIYVPETTDADGNITEAYYLISNQTYEIKDSITFILPQTGADGTWNLGLVTFAVAASIGVLMIMTFRKKDKNKAK
jgi:LPXTG-motif cell wall-anchored protein